MFWKLQSADLNGVSSTFEWFSQQHSGQGTLHCLLKLCNSPWDFRVSDPCGATERTRPLLSAQSGDGGVCWVFFQGYVLHVVLHFHHTNRLSRWKMIFRFWRQTHLSVFNKHKEVPSLTMWNYGPPANRWMEKNGLKIEVCLIQNDRIVLLQTSWSKDSASTRVSHTQQQKALINEGLNQSFKDWIANVATDHCFM